MTTQNARSLSDLEADAHALAPIIAGAVKDYRGRADLPAGIVAQMTEAGLHRAYMPKRYGGLELDWGAHHAISSIIAQSCGSAGWISGLVFSHAMFIGRFPVEAQDAFFESARTGVLATASAGAGTLEPAPGGMRLSGRWGWASGVSHADGLMVIAKQGDGPLFTHFCLLLPGEYEIEHTWDCAGLHATGSHHVRVENIVVPAERLVERDLFLSPTPPGGSVHESYIYRVRPAPYQKSFFTGPLLGTATGALEAGIAKTATRRGQIVGEKIADQVPAQVNIGVAVAEVDTARLVFEDYLRSLHEAGAAGREIEGDDILRGRRNVTLASRLCLAAAERINGSMGASGQLAGDPTLRLFLDCRAITSHVELNWDHSFASTGMKRMGIPTGDPHVDGHVSADGTPAMLGTQI